ncbi:MAG: DUF6677 family protein [Planctomycetaceae bacterium]
MSDPRIPLKNRWLAGLLAYLIPGAGHAYQKRYFKGALYFLCILPTFLFGMHLGEWKITYWQRDPGNILNPYYAQFWVGLPSFPSLFQARRYREPTNVPNPPLNEAVAGPFEGELHNYDHPKFGSLSGPVKGEITLEPVEQPLGHVRGKFTGTLLQGDKSEVPIEVTVGGRPELEKRVSGNDMRKVECTIVNDLADGQFRSNGTISGSIPRRFWDWFQVPLDDENLQALHGMLGKFHELAQVFTMIAGLLNILAIWDAVEGPAYGFGDSQVRNDPRESTDRKPDMSSSASRPTTVAQHAAARSGAS